MTAKIKSAIIPIFFSGQLGVWVEYADCGCSWRTHAMSWYPGCISLHVHRPRVSKSPRSPILPARRGAGRRRATPVCAWLRRALARRTTRRFDQSVARLSSPAAHLSRQSSAFNLETSLTRYSTHSSRRFIFFDQYTVQVPKIRDSDLQQR